MTQEQKGRLGNAKEEKEEEQFLKLALGQWWVWSFNDFIFLVSIYEERWPVLSLTVSSFHWQCTINVLIVAELARERRWSRNLEPNFRPAWDLNPDSRTSRLAVQHVNQKTTTHHQGLGKRRSVPRGIKDKKVDVFVWLMPCVLDTGAIEVMFTQPKVVETTIIVPTLPISGVPAPSILTPLPLLFSQPYILSESHHCVHLPLHPLLPAPPLYSHINIVFLPFHFHHCVKFIVGHTALGYLRFPHHQWKSLTWEECWQTFLFYYIIIIVVVVVTLCIILNSVFIGQASLFVALHGWGVLLCI